MYIPVLLTATSTESVKGNFSFVTFGHNDKQNCSEKILFLRDNMHTKCYHSTHLAVGKGQKRIDKILSQKKCENLRYGCDAKRQVFCGDYTLSKN